jgi:hypothetical protein
MKKHKWMLLLLEIANGTEKKKKTIDRWMDSHCR